MLPCTVNNLKKYYGKSVGVEDVTFNVKDTYLGDGMYYSSDNTTPHGQEAGEPIGGYSTRKFDYSKMNTPEERELWFCHRALQFKNAGFDTCCADVVSNSVLHFY